MRRRCDAHANTPLMLGNARRAFVNVFAPLTSFLLGGAVALLGIGILWLCATRLGREGRKDALHGSVNREPENTLPPRRTFFGGILTALLRPLDRLLGPSQQAIYQATYHTRSWSELCTQVEEAVRASSPLDRRVAIQVTRHVSWLIRGYRGRTGGFSVQLIPQSTLSDEGTGLLVINRWSRWHTWFVHLATGCWFFTLFGCLATVVVNGWDLPEIGYLILGASLVVTFVVARLLHSVAAQLESAGRNRLSDEELAAVVEHVRAVVERGPEVAVVLE